MKAAQAAFDAARSNVDVTKAQQTEAEAQLAELKTQLAKAERDLDFTFVRAPVDGIFSTYTTMVPYMIKWIAIFTQRRVIANCLPTWYFYYAAFRGLQNLERQRHCKFPSLERLIRRIAPRPLLQPAARISSSKRWR